MNVMKTTEFEILWPGGPRLKQAPGAFPLCTDSVLLARFVHTEAVRRCADLGCGAGALPVLLCADAPSLRLDGIELDPAAAALCRENLAANGLEDRANVVTGDLRESRRYFPAGAYDLVVSNPPYFPLGGGEAAPDPRRAAARDERSCTLPALCASAAFLCRFGGRFALVHRPERLGELIMALTGAGLEPKRLRLVCPRAGSRPSLVLGEARRGGKPGLDILPSLILMNEDGMESAETREIYRREDKP
jgi:tRNA1Val (adenine37-N6)-methyltransferase